MSHGYDAFADLCQALNESGAKVCFWFGQAPCPKCGGSHGAGHQPATREEAELRDSIAKARQRG